MEESIKKQVLEHAENLKEIFKLEHIKTEYDKLLLCRKLKGIETSAHKLMEDLCNGLNITEEETEKRYNHFLDKVDKLIKFRNLNVPVFLNGDARGYTIKIKDDYIQEKGIKIERDLGGYGIIAPTFRGVKNGCKSNDFKMFFC